MKLWNSHLCNNEFRNLLGYDIEEIAYLNIVKCRTEEGNSNVIRNIGMEVSRMCCASYLSKQLEILQPKYIVGHWNPVIDNLQTLGIDLSKYRTASMNGARHLAKEEKIREIKGIFEIYKKV